MAIKYLKTLNNWSLGLNNKDEENLIDDQELADLKNATLGVGIVSKRNGYGRYTPTALANPIHELYDFNRNDGTKELLAVSNLTLYKDTTGTLNALPFTGITSLTTNDVNMITYKNRSIADVVLLADGGKLKAYDGTNVSEVTPHSPTTDEQVDPGLNDLANLTNMRAIAIKKDRIFVLGHPTVKNRVSFCYHDPALGYATFDYFPAPFFIDVAAKENDEMIQLEVFRDQLIILGKKTLFALIGDGTTLADYTLHKINVPKGCIAPKSVHVVGNFLFYLSDDHVYRLYSTDQNYISADIASSKIEKTLNGISRSDKAKAEATYFEDKYYLSFPNGTTIVYDIVLDNWTVWSNVKANSFLDVDGVLYFSADTGLIYKFEGDRYNDDGVAIEFTMSTKNMDFELPVQYKKFKKVWAIAKQYDAESSTFDLKAKIGYFVIDIATISTDESGVFGEADWDSALFDFVDIVQTELRLRKKGKNVQFIISNNVVDQPLTLYGLVIQYKIKKP